MEAEHTVEEVRIAVDKARVEKLVAGKEAIFSATAFSSSAETDAGLNFKLDFKLRIEI